MPTLDPEAFGAAVIELLGNAEKRHRFGQYGIQKVKQFFRWDRIADQYDNVLQKAALSCSN